MSAEIHPPDGDLPRWVERSETLRRKVSTGLSDMMISTGIFSLGFGVISEFTPPENDAGSAYFIMAAAGIYNGIQLEYELPLRETARSVAQKIFSRLASRD